MRDADDPEEVSGPLWGTLVVAEYNSLRAEIIKLVELQSQLLALTVVAFGTIASVGFQERSSAILLVHPVLALILGVSWMNHAHSVCRCAAYIRDVEIAVGARWPDSESFFGWEMYVQRHPTPNHRIGFWGVRAIFAISALIALLSSLALALPRGAGLVLFILSTAVTALLFWLSVTWKEGSSATPTRPARRKTPDGPEPPRPPHIGTSPPTSSASDAP
jgi:hypothetical protein